MFDTTNEPMIGDELTRALEGERPAFVIDDAAKADWLLR